MWTDNQSVSTAVLWGKYTLSVVKWSAASWGWQVDTVPEHEWNDRQEWHYLAKGTARTREQGKNAAQLAASNLEYAEAKK